MRHELLGLLNLIFKNAQVNVSEKLQTNSKSIYFYTIRSYLRSIFSYIRYGSLFYSTSFIDVTGIESSKKVIFASHKLTLFYIFYLPNWSCRLHVISSGGDWVCFSRLSEFFSGASWPEREVSEMLGVIFLNKVDSRRLMLDYSFEGCPLLKEFPAIGYEEMVYSSVDRWVTYRFFRTSDTSELFYV